MESNPKGANPYPFRGLCESEVRAALAEYGNNSLPKKENESWLEALKEAITEPMFLLLMVCTIVYFSLGEVSEGFFMFGAVLLITAISFFQSYRSKKALTALKEYMKPSSMVIRNNELSVLPSDDLVCGDIVVVSEGETVPADGILLQMNDFSVDESLLTGEAYTIYKDLLPEKNKIYRGTLVQSGQGVFKVTAIGKATQFGKIGQALNEIKEEKSPLQLEIERFVKRMAAIGSIVFLIIWGINFIYSRNVLESLLKGLTIAMSVLPEEIPVAFTTFMALGAWRLMQKEIIVKNPKTIELLGSATVLCIDKTGTITENKMELHQIFAFQSNEIAKEGHWKSAASRELISTAMWASEPVPFDPMEKALHQAYESIALIDERPKFKFIHEYPLSGSPPMMTHIYENNAGIRIVACKGAPEAVLNCSSVTEEEKAIILRQLLKFAAKGFRVLGVGAAVMNGEGFPEKQQEFAFQFLGLLGFYDPPKRNIADLFKQFYDAGIEVKIITGDNSITTAAIAKQAHFKNNCDPVTGTELMQLSREEQEATVIKASIFTRMYPEAKLKIVNLLKDLHQVVGMTGDGVNDAPALKAAHIGIAMGRRGSEVAKQASSLIIADDDLSKMILAVEAGRKIFNNLKKAIRYIVSIHIPIILTVILPLIMGWRYASVLMPIHIIFLELIMGPTCSIAYENEPLEENVMKQLPRSVSDTFLEFKELMISIIQGLVITAGIVLSYHYSVMSDYDEKRTRTMIFTTLLVANIILTLVNRSFQNNIFVMLRYKNNLLYGIIVFTVLLLGAMLYIPSFASFFKLTSLTSGELGIVSLIACASVLWIEGYKWVLRQKR